MTNILISATHPQRFLDQLAFAQKVKSETEHYKIFLFVSDEIYSRYSCLIDRSEFKVINHPRGDSFKVSNRARDAIKDVARRLTTSAQRRVMKRLIGSVKVSLLYTWQLERRERNFLEQLEENYKKIRKLVKEYEIDILLLNGDRHLGYEPVFLKVSKELKIPSVIVYLVHYADEESILNREMPTKKIKTNWLNSSYIKRSQDNPKYVVLKGSYYYSHPVGNALSKFGVLTPNPYVMGSGFSSILCLNNVFHKNYYIHSGVNEDKIKVLGDPAYDSLFESYSQKKRLKSQILYKYDLAARKKILFLALPQLGEHNILPWKEHWDEIEFLVSNLCHLQCNILVSLHPKMNASEYMYLERKYDCVILEETLSEVLPAADLFVATYSSTVVWSVLCGIKTVVVDFYGLNLSMYDFLTSIMKIENKECFEEIVSEFLTDNVDFSADWKMLSRDEVFDGKTIHRYINLFRSIVAD